DPHPAERYADDHRHSAHQRRPAVVGQHLGDRDRPRLRRGVAPMSTAMISVPETAARDEIVEVKILISHPMETGFRTGADGRRIPRDIVHSLRCIYNGEEVFRTEIFPAIAANPYFAFHLRAK